MEGLIKGDVVIVPYPFSDLSQSKRRPALVLAVLPYNDILLCQITSQSISDPDAVALDLSDFSEGRLSRPSNVRPGRLFTADEGILLYKAGRISKNKSMQ